MAHHIGRYVNAEHVEFPFPAIRAGKAGRPQLLNAAGAVSLDVKATELSTSSGTDVAITIAAGDDGQEKLIVCTVKGGAGNFVLTGVFQGGTTLTFDTVGDCAKLVWMNAKWQVMATNATLA